MSEFKGRDLTPGDRTVTLGTAEEMRAGLERWNMFRRLPVVSDLCERFVDRYAGRRLTATGLVLSWQFTCTRLSRERRDPLIDSMGGEFFPMVLRAVVQDQDMITEAETLRENLLRAPEGEHP